jgi:SAM-dependent methyltransferase
VDANAKALDSAKAYLRDHLDDDIMAKIEFAQADIPTEMAELTDRKFDMVYSRLLFSYVPEPRAALHACKELLWKGNSYETNVLLM